MKYLLASLFFYFNAHCSFPSDGVPNLNVYLKALNEIRNYDEFRDYLKWATSENIVLSDEVLYSAEVLNVCSKCEEADGTLVGVKERLDGLEVKLNEESRAVLFFTEIIGNCFSVILKTTFNANFSYEGGMFIGKQAYFQFTLEGGQPKICSRMILDIH